MQKYDDAGWQRLKENASRLPITRRKPDLVYFVLAPLARRIKIGIACDPWARLAAMQTGSPERLELIGAIPSINAREYERELHQIYRPIHSHGEWFVADPNLLRLIDKDARPYVMELEAARPAAIDEVDPRPSRPTLPVGTEVPKGKGARLARYKLARGITD